MKAFRSKIRTQLPASHGQEGGLAPALSKQAFERKDFTSQMGEKAKRNTWRVFCAIELPEGVRTRVIQHIASLKRAVPDVHASWSRDANLHLTLKFLGEIPQNSVPDLSDAASRAVADVASFKILLEETGVFPKHGAPRVLWLGISDPEGRLGELHARLEDQSAKAGFQKEVRPFNAHLTLARLRKPTHARTLAAAHKELKFEPAEIAVSELLVIRSELSSEGPKYSIVSRHPLGLNAN